MKQLTLNFQSGPPPTEGKYIVQIGETFMLAEWRREQWWAGVGVGINGVRCWAAMPCVADLVEVVDGNT
jgi:hypothetical protein